MALALALEAHTPTDLDARSYAIKVLVADERLPVPITSLRQAALAGPEAGTQLITDDGQIAATAPRVATALDGVLGPPVTTLGVALRAKGTT